MDLSFRLGREFDTTVLVPRVPGAEPREDIDGVHIERFAYFPRRWEDLAHGAMIENLRSKPSRWLQVLPFIASESINLRRLIRRHRPDVLHVHWLLPQGLAALLVGRKVPWVVSTLGGDVYAFRGWLARRLKHAILRRAAAVTAYNADMRDRLVALGADEATTHVQSFGAEIGTIRQLVGRDERRIPGRILFVGRLVEKKGVAVLLEAVRRLPADLEWSLEIVGDGPLRDQLQSAAADLNVSFTGAGSRAQVACAYARSSLVVVPSVPAESGDQDGLPTVLLEAMGCGLAVVGSDLPGINEAIVDGETGLLVPPNDPDALAAALVRLLTDDQLRARLAEAAQVRSEAFTVEACAERLVEIVRSSAGDASTRA